MTRAGRANLIALAVALVAGQSPAAREEEPVAVEDAIRMRRLADADYIAGTPSEDRVAHFLPGRFVVLLYRETSRIIRTSIRCFSNRRHRETRSVAHHVFLFQPFDPSIYDIRIRVLNLQVGVKH